MLSHSSQHNSVHAWRMGLQVTRNMSGRERNSIGLEVCMCIMDFIHGLETSILESLEFWLCTFSDRHLQNAITFFGVIPFRCQYLWFCFGCCSHPLFFSNLDHPINNSCVVRTAFPHYQRQLLCATQTYLHYECITRSQTIDKGLDTFHDACQPLCNAQVTSHTIQAQPRARPHTHTRTQTIMSWSTSWSAAVSLI